MSNGDDVGFENLAAAEDLSVCDRCFSDSDIKQFIRDSATMTVCDFCGRRSRTRAISTDLVEVVEFMLDAINREYDRAINALGYESAEGGYQGAHWDTDELLSDEIDLELPNDHNGELREVIVDCLGDEPWCKKNPYSLADDERYIHSWETLCHTVKHRRRYFFHTLEQDESEAEILSPSKILRFIGRACVEEGLIRDYPKNYLLYRARQTTRGRNLVTAKDFGPPPHDSLVSSNRMSPAGIVMFYCSDKVQTACAEIDHDDRRGISVGTFSTTRAMKILDLSRVRSRLRFFEPQSESDEMNRNVISFLDSFVESVAKRLDSPHREHVDYVPTQVVTEWFRSTFSYRGGKIDGICYPSAQRAGGRSFVLFAERDDLVLTKAEIAQLSPEGGIGRWFIVEKQKSAWLRLVRKRIIRLPH